MSLREHRNNSCANSVFSYFWNVSKMVLWKNYLLFRLHLILSTVAGNGLHRQMAKPQRLIQLSHTYTNALYNTVHVFECKMFRRNSTLYKSTFWRRRKTVNSQIPGIWYLGLNDIPLYIWCVRWWVCGVLARPENRGVADGCFMSMHMREFYFVLWKTVMVQRVSVQMGKNTVPV